MDDLSTEIRRLALQNALGHGGQTREKTVLGKLLGARPELRQEIARVSPLIAGIVREVNAMPEEAQRREAEGQFPGPPEPRQGRGGDPALPGLEGAERGMVVTRFPPEPNGYPHIGHAKAAIINSEYARMYDGRFILRMDDTNPESERMEYHAAIKVGLEWLGIEPDVIKSTSDDMGVLYEKGGELVGSGRAYVCTCKRDDIGRNRRERRACKCSMRDAGRHATDWEKMHEKFRPGEAILRFRGDMGSDNAVMRDPVLFRIVDAKHYVHGDRYRVWPSYDMAVAIEDSIDGVTHAFRSKEFEARRDLTAAILGALGMEGPRQGFFSRLEFRGMPTSKRVIRPLIEEGKVSWYDDPRLPTLEALKRRGIRPGAVRRFVMSLGLTKADTLAPFDALEAFNRKLVDADSTRLFMADDPRVLAVEGLPEGPFELPNHPGGGMGSRSVEAGPELYIPGADAAQAREGARLRLMGIGDVIITRAGAGLAGRFAGGEEAGVPRIQWVSKRTAHRIKVIVPGPLFEGEEFNGGSLRELDVYTEPHYLQLKEGEEIQFVRFGYCRKDSRTQAIFTHK